MRDSDDAFLKDVFEPDHLKSLAGKRALITGATAGIGLATAAFLAAEGVHLVLVARREQRLKIFAETLRKKFPDISVEILNASVTDGDFSAKLVNSSFHKIDILVNNAGLASGADTILNAKISDWEKMLSTNVTAAFQIIHTCLPHMVAQGAGHIVNLCSIAGHVAYEGGSVYCATKHALRAFTQALRQETCDKNIQVTLISPGMVETEFSKVRFSGDTERSQKVYEGMIPLNSKDIARQIIFALKQPSHCNVDEILVMPTVQGAATKVFRTH